ncbi:hypothetical protein CR513_21683, partial [Mucuna pruriens]
MEGNRMVVSNMRDNNIVGSSIDKLKGSIQPRDLILCKTSLRIKTATNNWFPNTRHHLSDNSNNNQFSNLIVHLRLKIYTKYVCHNVGFANTNWAISHLGKSATVQEIWTYSFLDHPQSTRRKYECKSYSYFRSGSSATSIAIHGTAIAAL